MKRAWLGLVTMGLLAGCGGHHGGGSGVTAPASPNVPMLSSPSVTYSGPCTVPGTSFPGTVSTVRVSYADADGDLRGGTVRDVSTSNDGQTVTLDGAIPSTGVTVTGTTSGQITLTICVHFGSSPASTTDSVTVTDAAGNVSNTVSATVNRPAGAPERTRS